MESKQAKSKIHSRNHDTVILHSQFLLLTPLPDAVIQLILDYWQVLLLEGKFQRKDNMNLDVPIGVAVAGEGSNRIIAIVEFDASRVQICRYDDLSVLKVIGAGYGPDQVKHPCGGVAIDGDELYVADTSNTRIQVFSIGSGTSLRTVTSKGRESISHPRSLAIRGDEVYVCEYGPHRISVWNHQDAGFLRKWGQLGRGDTAFNFGDVSHICFSSHNPTNSTKGDELIDSKSKRSEDRSDELLVSDPKDNVSDKEAELFVADSYNKVIKVFNSKNGRFLRKFGSKELNFPTGISANENYVYVADRNNHMIVVFGRSNESGEEESIQTIGSKGNGDGELHGPRGIVLAGEELVVADYGNQRVQWFQ